jgi:hypothetical protein
MTQVCSVYSQLLQLFPRGQFANVVKQHHAEFSAKGFTCWEQFVAMLFCQVAHLNSLREVCLGLAGCESPLKHLGISSAPKKSTLAYANANRPWELYESIFMQLLEKCRTETATRSGRKFRFKNKLMSLDGSIIELSATMFDWAKYRQRKGAIKLHLLLDHDGYLPSFAVVTDGKYSELKVARSLHLEAGTILAIDRGYNDYEWFGQLTRDRVFFVTRMKTNTVYTTVEVCAVPEKGNVIGDQIVSLPALNKAGEAPVLFRRIEYWNADKQEVLVFFTNLLHLAASTVAAIYKDRWQIGVSSQGHINQPVQVRPRLTDSSLVAWEASWSESEPMKPSDNMLRKEYAQLTRLQRAVNADVASLHENPEAETVDNVRKQQEPIETSPMRWLSPAGYQRRHGEKENVATGEALGARRRNLVEEATAITASGKCRRRRQGGGSGRTTVDGRAAKRVWREGPGPVNIPLDKVRQG